jgi:hypothetical protein|tara:strand:- start:8561 stop:9100 length:540 start_codon:yes stop_codon:yes gene_type:complete
MNIPAPKNWARAVVLMAFVFLFINGVLFSIAVLYPHGMDFLPLDQIIFLITLLIIVPAMTIIAFIFEPLLAKRKHDRSIVNITLMNNLVFAEYPHKKGATYLSTSIKPFSVGTDFIFNVGALHLTIQAVLLQAAGGKKAKVKPSVVISVDKKCKTALTFKERKILENLSNEHFEVIKVN